VSLYIVIDKNLCLAQKYGSMGNGVCLFQNMGHVLPNVIRSLAHTFDVPTLLHWKSC